MSSKTTTTTITTGSTTTTTTTTTVKRSSGAANAQPPANRIVAPMDKEDITAEWVTAALHQSNVLPTDIKVVSVDPLVNIGDGRGLANYSWDVRVHYDKPVNPDIPTRFVYKQMNKSFTPNFPPGQLRVIANKCYTIEAFFYNELRDKMPIPLPKTYWAGATQPENPREEFGHYGILIEHLGDDVIKLSATDATSDWQHQQAMDTLAKLHASIWNSTEDPECFFTSKDVASLFTFFMGGTEGGIAYVRKNYPKWFPEGGAKYADYLSQAILTMDDWLMKGTTDHKHWAGFDVRTENMLWRKVHPKLDEYELVVLDHQTWCQAGSPMLDLAVFHMMSCTEEQMEECATKGIRRYYDQLIANGVKGYSWEDANRDFDNALWYGALFTLMGVGTLSYVEEGAMAHPEGSPERKEGLAMAEAIATKFTTFGRRGYTLINARNAWNPTFFSVPGY
eukprot:m.199228 g.199228  ORF g.199228 m.199228 type:complete len:450 (-) comp15312_c0_seq4:62-1411(-)